MNNFKKIILRNKIYKSSEIALRIDNIRSEKIINSKDKVRYIETIYEEIINSHIFEESQLYTEFVKVQSTEIDNQYFKMAYRVSENLAVKLTEHINIFRIADDGLSNKSKLVPWYCVESNVYVADTWWEEDKDILDDFTKLSYLEFITKYKMY